MSPPEPAEEDDSEALHVLRRKGSWTGPRRDSKCGWWESNYITEHRSLLEQFLEVCLFWVIMVYVKNDFLPGTSCLFYFFDERQSIWDFTPRDFFFPEKHFVESHVYKSILHLKVFAQTMYLKFRGQSRHAVKGKEIQLLKISFKTHNARVETKSPCSSNDGFPCASLWNESGRDSPLLKTQWRPWRELTFPPDLYP